MPVLDVRMRPGLSSQEVAALIDRARDGEVAAFERLIVEHQQKVFTFALTFTGDRERAKDLAQEALVKVYRSLGSYRFQSAFSTWLYAIVKNVYIDATRSRAGKERALERPLEAAEAMELVEAATAEERLIAEERRNLLWRALRQLPEPYRTVVAMADVQGLGYDEIGQALSLPVGTVKSRLNRGREALRAILFRRKEA